MILMSVLATNQQNYKYKFNAAHLRFCLSTIAVQRNLIANIKYMQLSMLLGMRLSTCCPLSNLISFYPIFAKHNVHRPNILITPDNQPAAPILTHKTLKICPQIAFNFW